MLSGLILEVPQSEDDGICSSFNKCVDDIGDISFSDGTDPGVASGKSYELCSDVEFANFASLEESVVGTIRLRRENQRRTVGGVDIRITVKSKMDDLRTLSR